MNKNDGRTRPALKFDVIVYFYPHRWGVTPNAIRLILEGFYSKRASNLGYIEKFDGLVSLEPLVQAFDIVSLTPRDYKDLGQALYEVIASKVPNDHQINIKTRVNKAIREAKDEILLRKIPREQSPALAQDHY